MPGLSQLFLLYNSQLVLCLFAGAGLAAALRRPRSAADVATVAVLALAALPAAVGLAHVLPAAARADAAAAAWQPSPVQRDYADGLAWLRAHAARDAVVFADNPSLLLSGIGETRLYYENGVYTARAWQAGPSRDPWPERTALQERLLRRPDEEAVGGGAAGGGRRRAPPRGGGLRAFANRGRASCSPPRGRCRRGASSRSPSSSGASRTARCRSTRRARRGAVPTGR